MRLDLAMQFIHLAILHFNPSMLVMIFDETRPAHKPLFTALNAIEGNWSKILLSTSALAIDGQKFCIDCPTRRLTIVDVAPKHFDLVKKLLWPTYNHANRLILVGDRHNEAQRIHVVISFMDFNAVSLELREVTGNLSVVAWGKAMFMHRSSIFEGAESLFRSADENAVLFLQTSQKWPTTSGNVEALLITNLIAPYEYVVQQSDGKRQVACPHLALMQLIGKVLRFSL